jgi:RNA polymerase sigma-70 factor (ECF subfamily)
VIISDDAELLGRLSGGDEAAFTELVTRYHPQLVRFARTYVSRPELAEDVAQETWIAALRGLDKFEGRSSLRTWLFRICANRARTAGQTDKRTIPVDNDPILEQFAPDGSWISPPQAWAHEIAGHVDDADLVRAVHAAILELPDMQRQVVTLRDVQGLTAQEVCDVLTISDANQRVLLHRGRTGVRDRLDRRVGAR